MKKEKTTIIDFKNPYITRIGFDRFENIEQIGRGGHGEVYRAFCKIKGEHVALKKLKNESFSESFDREVNKCFVFEHLH